MIRRSWQQLSINVSESYQDLLVGILTPLGFVGFLQEKENLSCFMPTHSWSPLLQKKFHDILQRFKSEFPSLRLTHTFRLVKDHNWNKTWEKRTGVVEVTPWIIIKPSWSKLSRKHRNKLVLHIDPKMSFGTGHHETTRLSLALLEQYLQPGMKVLDFGCGTGILGIAAIRLGAHSTISIDNDPWAIMNTKENARRNGVLREMKILDGDISAIPRKKFNLIISNIDYQTISKYMKSLANLFSSDGIIIISGILTSNVHEILRMSNKFHLKSIEVQNDNEWSAIAFKRK